MMQLERRKRNRRAGSGGTFPVYFLPFLIAVLVLITLPFVLEKEAPDLISSFEESIKMDFLGQTDSKPNGATLERGASTGLPKTLVIYFPQYHRDPVNDRNWGDNFTDWDSLRDTPERNKLGQVIPRPLMEIPKNSSHNLPPPLGYYDLTHRKPRKIQGQLAKKYGIDGFIYHHYWFYDPSDPGPTLAKPLENMLEDGHPDIPFILNWCAVRWVNVWMGKAIFQTIPTNKNRAITLQEQYFNATDDMIYQHYQWLKPFFHHPNYIRVHDQPAFLVYYYDPQALPILETLRKFAIEDGFPGLHFIVGRSSHHEDLYDTSHIMNKTEFKFFLKQRQTRNSVDPTQAASKVRSIYSLDPHSNLPLKMIVDQTWDYNPFNQTMTYPYPLAFVNKPFEVPNWCMKPGENSTTTIPMPPQDHPEIIGVVTAFDNTPRRKYNEAKIWNGGDPENAESPEEAIERFSKSYHAALYYQKCCVIGSSNNDAMEAVVSRPLTPLKKGDVGSRFVAINSMNEWAEGMAIEPSNVYGYRWLETIKAVQKKVKSQTCALGNRNRYK